MPASLHAGLIFESWRVARGMSQGIDDRTVKEGLTFNQKDQKIAASGSSYIGMDCIL
ncbi:hypothetical protein EMIT0P258_20475 [Pseudomonas sp. IT-P258]